MTDLGSKGDAYFASLNPLTKKIIKEVENLKKTYGDEWEEFSPEKQEELLDKFLIDPRVAEKFSEAAVESERPNVFPNYKIENGEKIVVDFDNEEGCNTWRDEHSGPFCWRTRSQQDLTLDDFDEPREKGRSKRSRSPEREGLPGVVFPNNKNIWDTQHLTAEQEKNETEEEIFRKFGITFSSSNGEDEESEDKEPEEKVTPKSQTEESKLLPSCDETMYGAIAPDVNKGSSHLDHAFQQPQLEKNEAMGIRSTSIEREGSVKGHKKKKEKSSLSRKQIPEAEQALIPQLSLNMTEQQSVHDVGQLSPVFMEDPGESTTDPKDLDSKFDFKLDLNEASSAITVQPTSSSILESPLDDWASPTNLVNKDAASPSTGFDFLDNW